MMALIVGVTAGQNPPAGGRTGTPPPPAMTLTSTAWPDGAPIPAKYTQAGEQVSPALNWTNAPPGTQSFVLNFHDPDVARNKTTDDQAHWVVWNIPGTATGLPEGVPQGAERPDGSRQISASCPMYRGPGAPATGPQHHYTFEIYALDIKLDVRAIGGCLRDARQCDEGHAGPRAWQGGLRRPVPTAAIDSSSPAHATKTISWA